MKIEPDLSHLLREHPFLTGMDDSVYKLLSGCAKNTRYAADEVLAKEGEPADELFLIRRGRLAVELHVHHEPVVVRTYGPGELVGWSWLVPPHRWAFDVRAVELTRAVSLDGACLRQKCEADPSLGFELLRRFAHGIESELVRSWTQMVDIYGTQQ